ncbi:MAG: aldo/keto reductase [Lachnospiraceae bacterium]|jgi:diketogulonate reductase-like aldo/keto reductase|nr:aldo/keto reductase [Lachnospiraceae bacterium]
MKTITLYNGVQVPQLGLGVFKAAQGEETEDAVKWALEAGYRHIDTAAVYGNERSVGKAVRESGIPREDVFITAKVWNSDIRAGRAEDAFFRTLDNLQTDYVDLYLLHWPVEGKEYAWSQLEDLYVQKRIRAIGVSNFHPQHLEELMEQARIKPMVDQLESHPLMNNQELIDYLQANEIAVGAWSPLGGPQLPLLQHPVLLELAEKYHRTPAQIVLRWDIQRNIFVIPKSTHRERIISNSEIFDFELAEEDMERIRSLDRNFRVGPDPDNFNF